MQIKEWVRRYTNAWFYRKDCRDDGLWHNFRDPTNGWMYAGIMIASGVTWTTPADMRGNRQIPPNAKGVKLSVAFTANNGGFLMACEGGRAADSAADENCGESVALGDYIRSNIYLNFGIDGAGAIIGTVSFTSLGQHATLYITPIGWLG